MRERDSSFGEWRFARFPVDVLVIAQAPQFPDRKLHGMIRNIGRGGLMADFAIQLVPGSLVDLSLHTRDGLREETGRAVWESALGDVIHYGIAFLEPKGPSFRPDILFKKPAVLEGDPSPEGPP